MISLYTSVGAKCLDHEDLTKYGYQSVHHGEFNNECSMLMVSGILLGDITGRTKGEIMVFTLKNNKLRICARYKIHDDSELKDMK